MSSHRRGGVNGKRFDLPASRRRSIERYASNIGVADTDDFPHVLIAWQWHNTKNSKDPAGALIEAAKRMDGTITEQQAEQIIEEADARPKIRKADALGKYLGLTDKMRTTLQAWTIGSSDVSSRQRKQRRKERKRKAQEAKRRARGTQTRAEYLAASITRARPWVVLGMSRATYYRRGAKGNNDMSKRDTHPRKPPGSPDRAARRAAVRQASALAVPHCRSSRHRYPSETGPCPLLCPRTGHGVVSRVSSKVSADERRHLLGRRPLSTTAKADGD